MFTRLYVKAQGWLVQDEGATAVEYGLMVAAIAVAIVVIVFTLGDQIAALFQRISTAIGGR
jgi:pilus assembly protein Flp/PilA